MAWTFVLQTYYCIYVPPSDRNTQILQHFDATNAYIIILNSTLKYWWCYHLMLPKIHFIWNLKQTMSQTFIRNHMNFLRFLFHGYTNISGTPWLKNNFFLITKYQFVILMVTLKLVWFVICRLWTWPHYPNYCAMQFEQRLK